MWNLRAMYGQSVPEKTVRNMTIKDNPKWKMIIAVNFPIKAIGKKKPEKLSRLQRDSSPWPPRYRCDALPTELWSHTLGARPIYWVHISREEWNDVKYIWNNSYIWTAVVDQSRNSRSIQGPLSVLSQATDCTTSRSISLCSVKQQRFQWNIRLQTMPDCRCYRAVNSQTSKQDEASFERWRREPQEWSGGIHNALSSIFCSGIFSSEISVLSMCRGSLFCFWTILVPN